MAKKPVAKKAVAAPAGETREQKFTRLAIPRVTKALKAIDLIGNLSGGNYAYDDAKVEQIFGALKRKLNDTQAKFAPRAKGERVTETFGFSE